MGLKVCPHCGSTMFVGAITRGCAIESFIDENGNSDFKILKESSGDKYELEVLKCCRCKTDIKKNDLVEGVPCKECGKIVNPNDLNADGICEVCVAIKQRSELANASKEDLIMMLLNAEKQANGVTARVEKQIQKAEEVEAKQQNSEESEKEEKPVTKRGGRRGKVKMGENTKPDNNEENKSDNDTMENQQEESKEEEKVTEEETAQAINDIANQQEAPFPEVLPEALDSNNVQENTQSLPMNPPVEAEPTDGFKMFDDRDDEPF